VSRRKKRAEISDDPDHLFDHGLYIPTRTIYIGAVGESEDPEEEIDSKTSSRIIKSIHILESLNKEPINVIINNCGGDWYYGMSIYDALRTSRCKVFIKVYGWARSMTSIILQAGNKRILSPNSIVMIHDGEESTQIQGSPKTAQNWLKESIRVLKEMYKIYYNRMKEKKPRITMKYIETECANDRVFTAKEAVEYGLADEIMKEKYVRHYPKRESK